MNTAIQARVPAAPRRYPQQTTAELQQLAAATPVVGCPCLSAHHPLLATRRAFDVVIVDEAGQIGLPAVLGALLKARSFVLVGDHYQLPPLVLDRRAAEGGLGVSLFRQLCEARPASVVVLSQQYRMCRRLAFVDTDAVQPSAAVEDAPAPGRHGVVNAGEAALLMQLLEGLCVCGVPGSDITLVSPYKAQVRACRSSVLSGHTGCWGTRRQGGLAGVEVLTIDRCQGRDKPVLLLSFVRSNHRGAVGTLLADWQRLNVAVTRAKVLLVMVGSARTLRGGVPLLAKMLEYVEREGQLVTLPADVLVQQQVLSTDSPMHKLS
ncbi:AAA domain-containing protein [Scenedesmus sp. NREL 46B-D3]|nr:AAA domain-containing protein [Scenedesmus sp. NREL 46B-D3]